MKYHTNIGVREEIDRFLYKNAKRQANLGTDSTEEELETASQLWEKDLLKIEGIDPDFAKVVHAQTD